MIEFTTSVPKAIRFQLGYLVSTFFKKGKSCEWFSASAAKRGLKITSCRYFEGYLYFSLLYGNQVFYLVAKLQEENNAEL